MMLTTELVRAYVNGAPFYLVDGVSEVKINDALKMLSYLDAGALVYRTEKGSIYFIFKQGKI